jgi:hypothetical protein
LCWPITVGYRSINSSSTKLAFVIPLLVDTLTIGKEMLVQVQITIITIQQRITRQDKREQ